MKRTIKKIVCVLMGLIMGIALVISGAGITIETLAVGETMAVGQYAFPRGYGEVDAYALGWGTERVELLNGYHISATAYTNIFYIDDSSKKIAYCLEPGVAFGSSMTNYDESYWDTFVSKSGLSSDMIAVLLGRLMQYGYTGSVAGWSSGSYGNEPESMPAAIATQILVWETIVGERTAGFAHVDTGSSGKVWNMISEDHPLRDRIMAAYNSIAAAVAAHSGLPSFVNSNRNSASAELQWDGSRYSVTLTDTNGVLANYSFTSNDPAIEITAVGNKLTISSNEKISGSVQVTAQKTLNAVRKGTVIWSDGNKGGGYQDLITYGADVSDPLVGYLNIETENMFGGISVRKTAYDNNVEGITFTVEGADADTKSYLARKDDIELTAWSIDKGSEISISGGVITLITGTPVGSDEEGWYSLASIKRDQLLSGNYIVKEVVPVGYKVDLASVVVTVSPQDGVTAENEWADGYALASFYNRPVGGLTIVKTADDGNVGNLTFTIEGASDETKAYLESCSEIEITRWSINNGCTISLADGVITVTTSNVITNDERGTYSLLSIKNDQLLPGDYLITEIVPEGYVSEGGSQIVTVRPADENLDQDEWADGYVKAAVHNRPTGGLAVVKTAEDDNVENISFTVEGGEEKTAEWLQNLEDIKLTQESIDNGARISLENGIVTLTTGKALGGNLGIYSLAAIKDGQLIAGLYRIKEIVPEGYKAEEPEKIVAVRKSDGTEDDDEWADGYVKVSFHNVPGQGTMILHKYDAEYPDNKLTGAEFTVYMDTNGNGEFDRDTDLEAGKLEEGTGDNEGVYSGSFDNGIYFIEETTAPFMFERDEHIYKVDISKGGETVYIENEPGKGFLNQPKKGSVTIHKKTSSGGSVANVEFTLQLIKDRNGNDVEVGKVTKLISDEQGLAKAENLDCGIYILTETGTAGGMQLLAEPVEIVIPLVLSEEEAEQIAGVENLEEKLNPEDSKYYFFDLEYDIVNDLTFSMPKSGGKGIWNIGYVLLAAAAAGGIVVIATRKLKRRSK